MTTGSVLMTAFGWDTPGGGSLIPQLLAKELASRGWAVTFVHVATGGAAGCEPYTTSETREHNLTRIAIHNLPSPYLDLRHPERDMRHQPVDKLLASVLQRQRPDVVHVHNLHNLGASVLRVAHSFGPRLVMTPHNFWILCPRSHLERGDRSLCIGPAQTGRTCAACVGDEELESMYRMRFEFVMASARECVDRWLAPSNAVAHALTLYGVSPSRVSVCRQSLPWLDLTWQRTAARTGRSGSPLRVGFVGSPRTHKGIPELAAACAGLAEVELHVWGGVSDGLREKIARLATSASRHVHVHGTYEHRQLPEILMQLDVGAHPSTIWDVCPLAVQEMQAGRLPVIATQMGGITDLVNDQTNGILVPPRSVTALRSAIGMLMDPGVRAALSANLRPPRTWGSYVDAVEAAYVGATTNCDREDHQFGGGQIIVHWVGPPTALTRWLECQAGVKVFFGSDSSANDTTPAMPRLPDLQILSTLNAPKDRFHPHTLVIDGAWEGCELSRLSELGLTVLTESPARALALARLGVTAEWIGGIVDIRGLLTEGSPA